MSLNRRYDICFSVEATPLGGVLPELQLRNQVPQPEQTGGFLPILIWRRFDQLIGLSTRAGNLGFSLAPTGTLLLVAVLLATFVVGCSRQSSAPVPPRVVKLGTVGSPELSPGHTFFGTTQSARRASLSFQVGGRIESIPVEIGDQVSEGQLLAQLDATPFELRIKQAEADLVSARAAVHERQQVFEAEKRLLPEGATTQLEYDQAEAAQALAKSRLEIAEATLRLAQRNLANTKLVAPMPGRIARRQVQNYTEVAPGNPIVELDGDGDWEIAVSVPEHFKLVVGLEVLVRLKGGNPGTVHGVVTKVGSRSEVGSTIPVLVKLKRSPSGGRTGTAAEVVFPQVDQKPAIILPVSAILPDRAGNSGSVFIYDNGIVKKRPIALGQPVGEGFLVESGISQGEKMVIAGVAFLMDGQSVRPFSFPGEEGVGRSKSTAE